MAETLERRARLRITRVDSPVTVVDRSRGYHVPECGAGQDMYSIIDPAAEERQW